ncbi:MAG: response regulator [Planctomycetes bacterium]|nr:response regulator [Planctomycetota bacterium]
MSTTALRPLHVLYVEDNPDDVLLVRQACAERQVNAEIHVVENAVQAFSFMARQGEYAAKPKPSVVILDLNLPIINGVKTLNIIKSAPEWRGIPVVILTSSQRPEERNLCMRMGVVSYQIKPKVWDDWLELASALKRVLDEGFCQELPKVSSV